jgi:hypothetical protein
MSKGNAEDFGIREQVLEEINSICSERGETQWDKIPDSQWRAKNIVQFVSEYIGLGQSDEILLERIAVLIHGNQPTSSQFLSPQSPVPKDGRTSSELKETEAERECRLAANEFIDILLSQRDDVMSFRKRLPGGVVMSADQAIDFLFLPVCRFFSFNQLEEWDVCSLTTEAKIISIHAIAEQESMSLPAGQFFEMFTYVRHARPSVKICMSMTTRTGAVAEKTVSQLMADYKLLSRPDSDRSTVSGLRSSRPVYFQNATTKASGMMIRTVEGFRNSIIGEALAVSERINSSLRWGITESLLYLMTGELLHDRGCVFASRSSLRLDTNEFVEGPSIFTVLPWVSPVSIAHLHKVMKNGSSAKQMPIGRNVRIFRFVNQERLKTPELTWEKLNEKWGSLHPEDAEKDYRNFHRDYRVTKAALFPPRD